jgi:hypothetical protein
MGDPFFLLLVRQVDIAEDHRWVAANQTIAIAHPRRAPTPVQAALDKGPQFRTTFCRNSGFLLSTRCN